MACVVPGCKSGNGQNSQLPAGVRIHRFPKFPMLREAWAKAIPRANWEPKKHSKICSLHFDPDDYTDLRSDRNIFRSKHSTERLSVPRLKPFAVPHIFPNTPSVKSPMIEMMSDQVSLQDSEEVIILRSSYVEPVIKPSLLV